MAIRSYYVEGCEIKEVSQRFLATILSHSDAFSLIYYKRHESEKTKATIKKIKTRLLPFKLDSRKVVEWPGTITADNRIVYNMITYRADCDVLPIIESVDTLWDWNYSNYPIDPAFYIDGYAWFYAVSHEHINQLYLKDNWLYPTTKELEQSGVKLVYEGIAKESDLFVNHYYQKKLL